MFTEYLDLNITLTQRVDEIFKGLGINRKRKAEIMSFLQPVKTKDRATYEHSLRVGLLAQKIGRFINLDNKALFYAGILHDVGKSLTKVSTLRETENWTLEHAEEIMAHVLDGYRMLRGKFDFSAEIILWHHRFQRAGYPDKLPDPLHGYSAGTLAMVPFYGRMLALADTFDALHRVNAKFGALSGEDIRAKMFQFNPDQRVLLEKLYSAEIFTTYTVPSAA